MTTRVYYTDQELPNLRIEWLDGDGAIINFSSGWTFTVKLSRDGTTVVSQTTSITGAATSPNLTVDKWTTATLTAVAADIASPLRQRDYDFLVYARRTSDSSDDVLKPGAPPKIRFITATT